MQERTELSYAPFFPRLAALALDGILLFFALLPLRLLLWGAILSGGQSLTAPLLFHHSLYEVLLYLVQRAYFVLLTYFGGCTLGKRAMGLRVVNAAGERCRFLDILYRETVGRYLSGFLCIGYLLVLGDRECRALHDRICDTRVVWSDGAPRRRGGHTLQRLETNDPVRDWYKPYRI